VGIAITGMSEYLPVMGSELDAVEVLGYLFHPAGITDNEDRVRQVLSQDMQMIHTAIGIENKF
jgi:hypothetical protein